MTNRNAFMNWIAINGNSVVGVYLDDRKGTFANEVEFGLAIVPTDKNLLSDLKFVRTAVSIGTNQSTINNSLAMLRERM